MVDPIRACLDVWVGPQQPSWREMREALRAVLDLCDQLDAAVAWPPAVVQTPKVRRVIAEHLGVTDV